MDWQNWPHSALRKLCCFAWRLICTAWPALLPASMWILQVIIAIRSSAHFLLPPPVSCDGGQSSGTEQVPHSKASCQLDRVPVCSPAAQMYAQTDQHPSHESAAVARYLPPTAPPWPPSPCPSMLVHDVSRQLEMAFWLLCAGQQCNGLAGHSTAPQQQRGRRRRPAAAAASAGGGANTFIGSLRADGLRFGVVAARFNELVTKPLLEGVLEGIERHGGQRADVDVRDTHALGALPVHASLARALSIAHPCRRWMRSADCAD